MKIFKYILIILSAWTFLVVNACSDTKNDDLELPPHLTNQEKPEGAIRLMTYNVATFTRDPGEPYNYQTIANMINEKEADVVCLNELDSLTTRTNRDYQLQKFAGIIGGWDFMYAGAMPYMGGSYGEGIATKEKAVKKYSVALPKGVGAEPRVLVVMEMEDFVIATTHLDHANPDAHAEQIKVINETIKANYQNSSKPVFLGGDLNAGPGSKTINSMLENWTNLSGTLPTFPSAKPTSCIDFIMQYKNGVKVELVNAYVAKWFVKGNAATASDHLPVVVDIRITSGKK